jgi:hypothetical protein
LDPARIKEHVFVVAINNSGSSYLTEVLSRCRRAIFLAVEGQFVPGFAGPVPREERLGKVWGHRQADYVKVLANPDNYDWDRIKSAWYGAAVMRDADQASVFIEKSPPNIPRVHMLREHFHDSRFIFMVRDPYALVEGISRARPRIRDIARVTADHVLTCLRLQKYNAETYQESVLIRYEDMCDDPRAAHDAITGLVPAFDDLQIDQKVKVKKTYDENLRNMNADQIARLSPKILSELRPHFENERELIEYFGYSLL